MRLTATEDTNLPIAIVYREMSDFRRLERMALHRGIKVQRREPDGSAEMSWAIGFMVRGTLRKGVIRVQENDPPNRLLFEGRSSGISGLSALQFMAAAPQRTRITAMIELSADTLPARLLLQPMKLARRRLQHQFQRRFAAYIDDIETRIR